MIYEILCRGSVFSIQMVKISKLSNNQMLLDQQQSNKRLSTASLSFYRYF